MTLQLYRFVRFRWWRRVDLKAVAAELGGTFSVEEIAMPKGEMEISLLKDDREELKVEADTLVVMLSAFRAVLSQKEAAPFTKRDLELREKILELYPRSRPTPFPWEFSQEPKFDVAS
jgi:hypothetical protein